MKVAGLVGAVAVVVAAAVLLIIVVMSSPTNVMDLSVGQCFNADLETEEIDAVDPVDCGDEHIAEVIASGELNPDRDREYPAENDLFAEADAACATAARGIDERFAIVPIPANDAAWTPLAGRYLCLAVPFGLEPTTGPAVSGATG